MFSNLNNFGLSYKCGNQHALWRYGMLIVSGNSSKETEDDYLDERSTLGLSVAFGREYRKLLTDKFQIRYGADILFGVSHMDYNSDPGNNLGYTFTRKDKETQYRPGLNIVFGFNYLITDALLIGAELDPGFTYYFGTSKQSTIYTDGTINELETDVSGFSYGLSNYSALISISYRFQ